MTEVRSWPDPNRPAATTVTRDSPRHPPRMIERAESWHGVFSLIVNAAHLAGAGDQARIVDDAAALVEASVQLYLIDLAQQQLHPEAGPSLPVGSTTADRAFQRTEIIAMEVDTQPYLWVPVLNGTERLGVAHVVLPAGTDPHGKWVREQCWTLTGLIGDGVTEARGPRGEVFGLDRLVDLTERHETAGLPAPETLRRITARSWTTSTVTSRTMPPCCSWSGAPPSRPSCSPSSNDRPLCPVHVTAGRAGNSKVRHHTAWSEATMDTSRSTRPALTLGVEEEFFLVHANTGEPVPLGPEVVALAKQHFGVDLDVELAMTQVETKTSICRDVADVRRQLRGLRFAAAEAARGLGCRLLAAGIPPMGSQTGILNDEVRYRRLSEDYRLLAAEQSICGCHVHVAVPDPETAVQVCNHLRPWLPVLGLLTANSPFAQGRDTGYASWRSIVWSRWPTAGPPPYFESAAHYRSICDVFLESGAAGDLKMVYWDVRPSSHLPTVEVRVADVAATADEAVLLAALVRGLVATALADLQRGLVASPVPTEALRVASWRAARDGIAGHALDVLSGQLVAARLLVDRLVHQVHDELAANGDLGLVELLLSELHESGTGAMRQRRAFERAGCLSDVVDQLAADTLAGLETRNHDAHLHTA